MDITGGGTAIMLAVAAGLWFLYLVPTWVRRREYQVTERAERILLAQQKRQDAAVARRVRAERVASPASTTAPARSPRMLSTATNDALRRQRMRRTRRLASLLMGGATVLGLVQIWLMATTGGSLGAWFVLAGTLAAGGVAIAVQRRLDQQSMPRAVATARPARSRIPSALLEGVPARPVDPAPWTPVAVPAPLYRSRPAPQRVAQIVTPQVDDMREAAPVVPIAARATSRFAAMGIVDAGDTAATDLDEVLRRRRNAG